MRRLIWIVLPLLVAAGCVKSTGETERSVALVFEPALHTAVRSDAAAYPDVRPFGVYAWQLPADRLWREAAEEAVPYLADERVGYADGVWSTQTALLWPGDGQRLTAIGYAPYGAATGCDAASGVRFDGVDVRTVGEELCYTDPQADLSQADNGGVVTLPFRSAFAQVDFRVKSLAGDDVSLTVRRIELDAANCVGNFHSLPEPEWTLEGEAVPVLFFEGECLLRNTPQVAGSTLPMLPQQLQAPVSVTFEAPAPSGETITQTIRTEPLGTRLEAGRHYTYTLSVSVDRVDFLLQIIEDRIK